jgi:hypothetical protein
VRRCRGFRSGPRCAWLAADKTIGGFRKVLPGFRPGPRCALNDQLGDCTIAGDIAGWISPGPRCALSPRLTKIDPCGGSTGFDPGPRCAFNQRTVVANGGFGVAWASLALVARFSTSTACRGTGWTLPGFGPGPRCAFPKLRWWKKPTTVTPPDRAALPG